MLTQSLAQAVLEPRVFPPEALNAAKDAFIDTMGVAIAGSTDECARIAQSGARGGQRAAGGGMGTPLRHAMEAAFANGIAGHALDFDDSMTALRGHPSVTLIPAILAAAEAHGASGRAALEAYVVGARWPQLLRQGRGVRPLPARLAHHCHRGRAGGHGRRGARAVPERAPAAPYLGIATSQSAGLIANLGTMTKPFHAGNAARSAVVAATLARAGCSRPTPPSSKASRAISAPMQELTACRWPPGATLAHPGRCWSPACT